MYGASDTPQDVMAKVVRKAQYIGQLELLAAVLVYNYYSVPELKGSSPIHWIDNQGVLSALASQGRGPLMGWST